MGKLNHLVILIVIGLFGNLPALANSEQIEKENREIYRSLFSGELNVFENSPHDSPLALEAKFVARQWSQRISEAIFAEQPLYSDVDSRSLFNWDLIFKNYIDVAENRINESYYYGYTEALEQVPEKYQSEVIEFINREVRDTVWRLYQSGSELTELYQRVRKVFPEAVQQHRGSSRQTGVGRQDQIIINQNSKIKADTVIPEYLQDPRVWQNEHGRVFGREWLRQSIIEDPNSKIQREVGRRLYIADSLTHAYLLAPIVALTLRMVPQISGSDANFQVVKLDLESGRLSPADPDSLKNSKGEFWVEPIGHHPQLQQINHRLGFSGLKPIFPRSFQLKRAGQNTNEVYLLGLDGEGRLSIPRSWAPLGGVDFFDSIFGDIHHREKLTSVVFVRDVIDIFSSRFDALRNHPESPFVSQASDSEVKQTERLLHSASNVQSFVEHLAETTVLRVKEVGVTMFPDEMVRHFANSLEPNFFDKRNAIAKQQGLPSINPVLAKAYLEIEALYEAEERGETEINPRTRVAYSLGDQPDGRPQVDESIEARTLYRIEYTQNAKPVMTIDQPIERVDRLSPSQVDFGKMSSWQVSGEGLPSDMVKLTTRAPINLIDGSYTVLPIPRGYQLISAEFESVTDARQLVNGKHYKIFVDPQNGWPVFKSLLPAGEITGVLFKLGFEKNKQSSEKFNDAVDKRRVREALPLLREAQLEVFSDALDSLLSQAEGREIRFSELARLFVENGAYVKNLNKVSDVEGGSRNIFLKYSSLSFGGQFCGLCYTAAQFGVDFLEFVKPSHSNLSFEINTTNIIKPEEAFVKVIGHAEVRVMLAGKAVAYLDFTPAERPPIAQLRAAEVTRPLRSRQEVDQKRQQLISEFKILKAELEKLPDLLKLVEKGSYSKGHPLLTSYRVLNLAISYLQNNQFKNFEAKIWADLNLDSLNQKSLGKVLLQTQASSDNLIESERKGKYYHYSDSSKLLTAKTIVMLWRTMDFLPSTGGNSCRSLFRAGARR